MNHGGEDGFQVRSVTPRGGDGCRLCVLRTCCAVDTLESDLAVFVFTPDMQANCIRVAGVSTTTDARVSATRLETRNKNREHIE